MPLFETIRTGLWENWPIWVVSITLIVAAIIDGIQLKVPNWITLPMIGSGWIYSSVSYAMNGEAWYAGLAWSIAGTAIGLALLLPPYAIGGMGAGDVKLLAGVGAWVHCGNTLMAFCISVVIGGLIAVGQIAWHRGFQKHFRQMAFIANEIVTIKNPETLSQIAAERKSSMCLLPYGIPICIGSIGYFAWMGMLL
jgi:prepilin peptidase CpaA